MPKLLKLDKPTIEKLELAEGKKQVDYFFTLFPGRSLIATVNASSAKSKKRTWSVMYYDKGKPRRAKLGEFPAMSVADARKAAREFDVEAKLATRAAGSFAEVAETFLKRHVQKKGLRSEREIRRILSTYVLPKWERREFVDITLKDVTELLDCIADANGLAQADAVRAVISKIMRWYAGRDERYQLPRLPDRQAAPGKRKRWLNDDEIRAVWTATEDMPIFGPLVRLLLLTGQRVGKVVTMTWDDIDLQTGEWRIPRQEREKGTPSAITLPKAALEIVDQQARVAGTPYVFAGRGKKRRFDSFSQHKAELDGRLASEMPPWVLHDLRRTCRKLMTRAKVPVDVAELALGHSIRGIQGVYDDPEEYRSDIDDALRRVAGQIDRILNPGAQVIALKG